MQLLIFTETPDFGRVVVVCRACDVFHVTAVLFCIRQQIDAVGRVVS